MDQVHQGGQNFPLTPVAKLLETPAPREWLVWNYLPPASLCMLFGEPAAGKSLIALDWAASIATGRPWCGQRVMRGPVVYIAGEGHFGISRRLKAWSLHHDCEADLSKAPLFVSEQGAAFTESESLERVRGAIEDVRTRGNSPLLIVVDTLHRNLGPGDENSSKDIAAFIQAVDSLRHDYGATVLIVHHAGHGASDRARGSSALRAAVDAEFCLGVE